VRASARRVDGRLPRVAIVPGTVELRLEGLGDPPGIDAADAIDAQPRVAGTVSVHAVVDAQVERGPRHLDGRAAGTRGERTPGMPSERQTGRPCRAERASPLRR